MEYIIVFFILLLGVILFDGKPDTAYKKTWLFIEWLLLILLAGLRYKVGGDTIIYQNTFDSLYTTRDILDSPKTENWNILWKLFAALCKKIYDDFATLQIIHAAIVNSVFIWFFKKKTSKYFLAILLYYLFFYFRYNTETMRAALSVCCFLLTYDYLLQKKYLKYYLGAVIAIGFHTESIVLLLFPIVHHLNKFKPNFFNVSILLMLAGCSLLFNFLPFFQDFASSFGNMSEKVAAYSDKSKLGEGVSILGYIHTFLANYVWLHLIIIIRLNEKRLFKTNGYYNKQELFIGFCIIHFFLGVLSVNYSNIFYRFQDFTNLIVLVALCQVFEIISNKGYLIHKIILPLLLIILIVDRILYFTSGEIVLFYPYSSIIDPIEYPEREWYYYSVQ